MITEIDLYKLWWCIKDKGDAYGKPKSLEELVSIWRRDGQITFKSGSVYFRLDNVQKGHRATLHGYIVGNIFKDKKNIDLIIHDIMYVYRLRRLEAFIPCELNVLSKVFDLFGWKREGRLCDYVKNGTIYEDAYVYSYCKEV